MSDWICPVCGWPHLRDKPDGSYEICPSCGTEFGYDDATISHEQLRQQWIKAGKPWFSRATPEPAEWKVAREEPPR